MVVPPTIPKLLRKHTRPLAGLYQLPSRPNGSPQNDIGSGCHQFWGYRIIIGLVMPRMTHHKPLQATDFWLLLMLPMLNRVHPFLSAIACHVTTAAEAPYRVAQSIAQTRHPIL